MADVRLTATNPEDSSVVPVACDAAGRLLLEEPVQGPAGEQGPPGQDGQDGDPFSGNFADDVTFGGSAEFAGNINGTNYYGYFEADADDNSKMRFNCRALEDGGDFQLYDSTGTSNRTVYLNGEDGNAEFVGNVTFGGTVESNGPNRSFLAKRADYTDGTTPNGHSFAVLDCMDATDKTTSRLAADGSLFGGSVEGRPVQYGQANYSLNGNGSAAFANGKAGFTKEGYLWCTTRRGDTVILDATSNGLASWVEYTPTTRLEEIRDKLDANRGDTGEMPTDTQ